MTADAPPPAPVLEGGLHPASFVLRLGRMVRLLGFVGIALAFRGTTDFGPMLGPIVFVAALGLVGPLLELASFRWRLTERELTVRFGVLARSERRIPVDRIHDLGVEQSFVRRLLGLVKVTVETSSTGGAEVTLDALDPATAGRLRAAIERVGGAELAGRRPEASPAEAGETLHRASVGALLARGLTDNRAGLLVLAAASLAQVFASATGMPVEFVLLERWLDQADRLLRAPPAAWLALGAVVVAGAFVFGWVVAAVATVVSFHGFELRERRGLLVRSFGLFTRRTLSLPRRRIQLVEVLQSPVRRLLGAGTLRVESAGSVAGEEGDAASEGMEVFAPFARRAALERLAERLVDGLDARALRWERTSRSLIGRHVVRGAVLGAGAALGVALLDRELAAIAVGPGGLAGIVGGAAAALGAVGLLRWRALRFAFDGRVLAFRDGVLGRRWVVVPVGRIEAVTLDAGPLDRLRRLAAVTVHVLGGGGVTVPNVPAARAQALVAQLGRRLVRAEGDGPAAGRARRGDAVTVVASAGVDPVP